MSIRFTEEQRRVIEHPGGHALVSAVAGAGKSTTLVEHCARKIEQGAAPRKMLVIQYNKSAQVEMAQKLTKRLGNAASPRAQTFHSVGLRMLKRLIELGLVPKRRLETSGAYQEMLMGMALKEAWKQAHGKSFPLNQEYQAGFQEFVTLTKANIIPAVDVFRMRDYDLICRPYLDALRRYEAILAERKIFFFDDMLSIPYSTLRDHPDYWSTFQWYEHILVDEFQDINPVQYALLQGLVGKQADCMAIGDPDQSIYRFRGSNPDYIVSDFAQDFSPCTTYRMTQTFRYGHETALLANMVITKNEQRDDKITVSNGQNDTQIVLMPHSPPQASQLPKVLSGAKESQSLHEHTMLVRYYAHAIPYEIELSMMGIPYHVYGRAPLVFVPEISALIAALSLSADYWVIPEAQIPIFIGAIAKVPTMYLGNDARELLIKRMVDAYSSGQSIYQAVMQFAATTQDTRTKGNIVRRADVIRLLEGGTLRGKQPSEVLDLYLKATDFEEKVRAASITPAQAEERVQTIRTFVKMSERFDTVTDLLDMLGPMAGHKENQPPEGDHFKIMSIHRAKGAEFSRVYLPAWAEGSFPRESEDIEEERRLAYVAITRAIHKLIFLLPPDKTLDNMINNLDRAPHPKDEKLASSFLYDGEIGVARKLASIIRIGQSETVNVRDARIPNRYLQETGHVGEIFRTPEALGQLVSRTDCKPDLVLTPGVSRLMFEGEHYIVGERLGSRYYYVTPINGGDPRLMGLDEPGWSVI